METTTSYPDLPPEILDHIVDLLYDDPEALRRCCLVSKSWVPRTRKHLFASVKLLSQADLDSWNKTFPDPMSSPAHHARTLTVECIPVDTEESGWIHGFSRVERLVVDHSLATVPFPFPMFAPSLKSIFVTSVLLPSSQLFDLIRFLLVLEDLTVICDNVLNVDEPKGPHAATSTSPPLTGTLHLIVFNDLARVVQPLLDLPGGLRFRSLELAWCSESDLPSVMDLVAACSDTLESLDIACDIRRTPGSVSSLYHLFTWTRICRGACTRHNPPLQSDKAERCRVPVLQWIIGYITAQWVGHHDAGNHHIQTPGSPKNLYPHSLHPRLCQGPSTHRSS